MISIDSYTRCLGIVLGVLVAPMAVFGEDLDSNGFTDASEQALVNRFCPSLVLNSADKRIFNVCPEPVEIFTDGGIWQTFRALADEGYKGLEFRTVTQDLNYSQMNNDVQDHAYAPHYSFDNCFTNGSILCQTVKHFDYGGPARQCEWQSDGWRDQGAPNGGWYQIYDEGIPPDGLQGGAGPGSAYPHTVYAHLFSFIEDNESVRVIQYWFFYPFNDWVNNHEGDWEHINVFVTSDNPVSSQIDKVVFYFHERYKIAADTQVENPDGPFDCYVVDGTHPVVFVGGTASETDCQFGVCSSGYGNGSHGSYSMPGTWNNVNERGYEDAPDGIGLWIPWTEIVDGDDANPHGVVLLKERNAYNYELNPSMSWLNANIRWGHPNVWSIGSEHTQLIALFGGTSIGNEAPLGPAYQDTWNTPYGNDRFDLYAFAAPYPRASMANWAPPSRMTVTFPGENANVTGELTIIGTIHYADEVVLEWGPGTSPSTWSNSGMAPAEIPMVQSTIGTWNTGVVPAGTYTIRVRSYIAGTYSEAVRTVSVTHQSISVAQVGGNFSTIQEGIDFAAPGDTVRVAMGSSAYPPDSITMKSGVLLIATGGPIRDVFGEQGTPTITINDHDWPCYIEGFTFRHGHVIMTAQGSAAEHGALITGASPVFRNCTFKYNVADRGGGVLIVADPGTHTRPVFESCTFLANRANVDGGAIRVDDAGTPPKTGEAGFECRDCTFIGNLAATNDAGSAVSVDYIGDQHEPIEFSNCHFSQHDINATGTYDETTVLLRDVSSLTTFVNCSFFDNGTTDIIRMENSDPTFDQCTFARNYGADGVFGWLSTTNGYPDVSRCVLAFNNGPVAVGSSGITSSMELENSIVYLNNDQGRGPTDMAWDSSGPSTLRIDPAFCNVGSFDFRLFAYSPAAVVPLPAEGYFEERVGAYDVGCVPTAVVTVTAKPDEPTRFPSKPWIVVACPKGDLDTLEVTVNFNNSITRTLDWREITLDVDGMDTGETDSVGVFDQSGYVEAQSDVTGPDFIATIRHPYFGGHGNDTVDILLNGHPLASQAHFELRSIDINGDGLGNIVDLGKFVEHYQSPPKAYNRYCDFSAAEYTIVLADFGVFGAHYGHTKVTDHQQLNSEPIESNAGIALQFTEEFPTANTHRLYVDVSVENFANISASAFSMQSGSSRLSFVNWIPAGGSLGDVLFSPVIRDGAEELFFGVLVSEAFAGTGATLGRLVFDVSGAEPMQITEENFVLTVGDVLLDSPEGNMVLATMEGLFARTLDPAVARVFHDRLEQNFPNPFNPSTTLAFSLKNSTNISLTIYDVTGRQVRELVNERRERGAYKIVWDGQNDAGQVVSSGVYFYKLVAGSFTDTKKMTILK